MKKILLLSALIVLAFEVQSQEKSYKRGVSYGYHSAGDMEAASQGISWWYNWAAQPDAAIRNTYQNYDVDFTPMAWNAAGISGVSNWAEYKIDVQQEGTYRLRARISGANPGSADFLVDGQSAVTVSTPNTGGWQSWVTVSENITLDAGEHTLKMLIQDGGFNINWIDFSETTVGSEDTGWQPVEVSPNPVAGGILHVQLPETLSKGDCKIMLFDVFGNRVLEKKMNANEGGFQVDFNEKRLPPGIYLLNITGEKGEINRRLAIP